MILMDLDHAESRPNYYDTAVMYVPAACNTSVHIIEPPLQWFKYLSRDYLKTSIYMCMYGIRKVEHLVSGPYT